MATRKNKWELTLFTVGSKIKNGCQRKINGSSLSLLRAKNEMGVLGKNKWELTLFTVAQN